MSVGIIGGSDGPTAVFVTGGLDWPVIVLIAAASLAVAGVAFWLWRRWKGKK